MDFMVFAESSGIGLALNTITFILSLVAVVFWIHLFQRLHIVEARDEGWLWIFSSVLLVLLSNLATLTLALTSGRLPLGGGTVFYVDISTTELVTNFSRLVMALALSIGTYKLYDTMKDHEDVKFSFSPLSLSAEVQSKIKPKYDLSSGKSYLVVEGDVTHKKSKKRPPQALDLFLDLATHGRYGLILTRRYPPTLRAETGLSKTPMLWLSKEKEFDHIIHPADLTELSHTTKDFITKGESTVVLLEGSEYLITHNSFDEILKLLEGLVDVVAQNKSIFIVSFDPSTVSENQYHLLTRELTEFKD